MEKHAAELLATQTTGAASPRVILDIDEDYFGCENAGDKLIKAGVDWTYIGKQLEPSLSLSISVFLSCRRSIPLLLNPLSPPSPQAMQILFLVALDGSC